MRKITTRKTGLVHRTRLLVTTAGVLLSGIAQANNCSEMPISENVYTIVNEANGRYMDVAGNSRENGGAIHLWSKNGHKNQQFKVSRLGDGYWYIHPTNGDAYGDSYKALDVAGRSKEDGARILQWDYWGGDNQQWKFIPTDNGSIKIQSRRSGKMVTIAQDVNGSKVYQRTALPERRDSLQSWYFNPVNSNCGGSQGNENSGPIGFAEGTTGGGNATPVKVNSCDQLAKALVTPGKAVIQLPNAPLNCKTRGTTEKVCEFTCGVLGEKSNPNKTYFQVTANRTDAECKKLFAWSYKQDKTRKYHGLVNATRYDRLMKVTSNKTLEGTGPNSKLLGVTLYIKEQNNIIIRNLAIEDVNPHIIEAGDAISMQGVNNIWIDHIRTSMISDGHIDVYSGKNITVSRSLFDGANNYYCGGKDPYVNLVKNTQATFHHNYWKNTNGRNPSVSGKKGRVHIFNNLWKGITGYGIGAYGYGQVKAENNYFIQTHNPHWAMPWDNEDTGVIDANTGTNVYVNRIDGPTVKDGRLDDHKGRLTWSVPYSYEPQSARDALFSIVDPKGSGTGAGPQ